MSVSNRLDIGASVHDRPTLIIEDNMREVIPFLTCLGTNLKIEGSSNRIFCAGPSATELLTAAIERIAR